ncbi:hypothetical protein CBER1_04118 [Cercospora berteroae]|uniref:Glutaminase A n=1 Tax=Cercospora berteroae TaxID=357750 RepID=A0A2S6CGX3_9PEZI|nr:hypothetical protein CBER1_04118 [Cercospora berteroae]
MSTWQQAGSDGGNGGYLPGQWPTFWDGAITGWCGMIRVGNSTYTWMGNPDGGRAFVNQTAFSYTSTKAIFTLQAGPVQMVVTFLSNVTPNDLLRSSLPQTYMNVDVKSTDGRTHNVQLYSDISAEWVSGDRGATAQWAYDGLGSRPNTARNQPNATFSPVAAQSVGTASGGVAYHRVYRQQQLEFSSINEQAEWGQWYFATANTTKLTFQSGQDTTVRGNFMRSGNLANTRDTRFRAINNADPVFGFAANIVAAGGADYAKITSLAVTQAFAANEFANTPEKPLLFMKEISSDGNTNTVDVIFPFHPIALYTNATLLKWLLDPLFINQEAGNWPKKYSIHDIGSNFPNATGHSDGNAEDQPLEECGNMVIMALAYAQRANDNAYLSQHYQILKQWTDYLIDEALIPANQISTDDFAGPAANQTNLAIKSIIGIEAMAQIANRTGNVADGQNYTRIAHDYITKWQKLGINSNANPPHTTFNYGNNSPYSLLYNLYADRELGLQLVPQSVYDMQSTFYKTKFNKYGVPLDTRHTYTKNDWEIFCAAIAASDTKSQFTSVIAKWLDQTPTNHGFGDLYDTISGDYPGINFLASPVVGGMFAFLALNSAPTSGVYLPRGS